MDHEAAKNNDDVLFGGLNIEGLEDDLLTVDVAEGEVVPEVVDTVKEVAPGGDGDPPKKDDEPPGNQPAGEVEKPKEDLIEVDTPAVEEGDKPDTQKPDTEKGKEADQEGTLSPMYLHAAALQETGLLPDFDLETIKSLEPKEQALKVNEHIQNTIKEEREAAVKDALGDVDGLKEMYEDIQKGVNPADLRENMTLEAQYGSITNKALEEDESLQEAIYTDVLSMKGLSDKKVQQLIQVAKDNDQLLVESTDGLKEINTAIQAERTSMREAAEKASSDQKEKVKETKEKVSTAVSAVKEIIPGVEITKAEQDALIKHMTVPVKFVKNGQGQDVPVSRVMDIRSKDPIAFEMRLNYFIEKGFFDKDAKFENIQATANTTASKKFFDKMTEGASTSGTPAVNAKDQGKKKDEFIFPFQTNK